MAIADTREASGTLSATLADGNTVSKYLKHEMVHIKHARYKADTAFVHCYLTLVFRLRQISHAVEVCFRLDTSCLVAPLLPLSGGVRSR